MMRLSSYTTLYYATALISYLCPQLPSSTKSSLDLFLYLIGRTIACYSLGYYRRNTRKLLI